MDGQGLSFSYSAEVMLCPIVSDTLIPMQCNHGGIYWCNIILARERSSTHSVTNSAIAQMYHLPRCARDALPTDYSMRCLILSAYVCMIAICIVFGYFAYLARCYEKQIFYSNSEGQYIAKQDRTPEHSLSSLHRTHLQ
jgi:hypothetical protein